MSQSSLIWIGGLLAAVVGPAAAWGHSPYGKVMKERYELRSVSCYACHVKGKDEKTGKPLGKEHLNQFGEVLHTALKDKKITERLEAAKKLSRDERTKLNEVVAAEFLEGLKKIEGQAGPGGKTWLELLKSGELEGITRAE